MGIIAPYVARILSVLSWADGSYVDIRLWLASPYLPAFHLLLVTLVFALLIHVFTNSRKKLQEPEQLLHDVSDRSHTKSEHLVWINKILTWLFFSSSPLLPQFVKNWIDNLNLHMANKKRNGGAVIYGLREGSAMPSLVEIKNVEIVGNSIHAKALLRSTEFGFLISVDNKAMSNGMTESHFSAIVTQFECWFSIVFTKVNGVVGLILKPTEKRPVFQINMKSLSKNTPETFKPEVIAQCLQEAVLETTVYANLDITDNQRKANEMESSSEKSFSSDSEMNEEIVQHSSGEAKSESAVTGSANAFNQRQLANNHIPHSKSVSGTRNVFPVTPIPIASRISDSRSGSIGSLNSIVRTSSSSRAPAKPIRYREKSLIISKITFQPEKAGDFYPLRCAIELNHPPQFQSTNLHGASIQSTLTFDLGSRSSGLNIVLESTSESKESLHLKGSVAIDGLDFDKSPIRVLLGGDNTAGVLEIKLHIKENQDQIHPTPMQHKKSNSSSALHNLAPLDPTKTVNESLLGDGKTTKVTTVTKSVRSTSGSPFQEVSPKSRGDQGVSYNSSSVVDAALSDLSRTTSPARKTKILITAVEESSKTLASNGTKATDDGVGSPDAESAEPELGTNSLKRIDDPSLPAASEQQLVHIDPGTPSPSSESSPEKQSGVKIRRTRSLIFRGSRKSKEKRLSAMGAENGVSSTPVIESRGSSASLHKKSRGLSKLFGKKKKLETLEDESSFADGSMHSTFDDGQTTSPDVDSGKIKRSRSLKRLIKSKKK